MNKPIIDGRRLRMERQALDMTQRQLAEKSGVHEMSIWRYEKQGGPIRRDCLELLAQALNVKPIWLCQLAPETPQERPQATPQEAITAPANTAPPTAHEALSNGRRMR